MIYVCHKNIHIYTYIPIIYIHINIISHSNVSFKRNWIVWLINDVGFNFWTESFWCFCRKQYLNVYLTPFWQFYAAGSSGDRLRSVENIYTETLSHRKDCVLPML